MSPAAVNDRITSPPGPVVEGRDAWNHRGPIVPPSAGGAGRGTGTVTEPTTTTAVRLTGAPPLAGGLVVAVRPNCQSCWPGPGRSVAVLGPAATPSTVAAKPFPRSRPSLGTAVELGAAGSWLTVFAAEVTAADQAIGTLVDTVTAEAGPVSQMPKATSPAAAVRRAEGRISRCRQRCVVVKGRHPSSPVGSGTGTRLRPAYARHLTRATYR